MTLDEAIESEKQEHEFCDYQNYHEQIAEWLEDYKRLKSIPEHTYENCHNLTCRRKCKKDGYNMAIDDFESKIIMHFADWQLSNAPFNDDETDRTREIIYETIENAIGGVEEIAEQLKAGGVNE